jgi:hypothetical protein
MVEVEIRAPIHNEESETIEWVPLALVRADGGDLEIYGEIAVPPDPVMSIATGKPVEQANDPEEWARNLPGAYRSGDLAAVILRDDNPPAVGADAEDPGEPTIPDPPETTLGAVFHDAATA